MRSNIKPENRRLLEALCYIDEEVLADVLADVTVPESSKPVPRKKVVIRSIKYAALLAACALLVGAVFPVITQLMNYFGEGTGTTPPVGSIQYSQYADYVLTEDDLAAINVAWMKEHTSAFADSVEDAMLRTRNGGHYFGKYGDAIVIWRPSVTCLVLKFSMNGHTFTFGSGTMYFFNGGNVYDQYQAESSELLTDEQIEALYKYYTDEYLNYDNNPTKPTPETTEQVFEPAVSDKELADINAAWAAKKGDGSIFVESRTLLGLWSDKMCAVEYGDCVLARFGESIVICRHTANTAKITREIIGEHQLWFGHVCEIWVCHKAKYYTVTEAYENNILTKDNIAELEARQREHNKVYTLDDYVREDYQYLEFMPGLEPLDDSYMGRIDRAFIQHKYDSAFDWSLKQYANKSCGEAEYMAEMESDGELILNRNKLFSDKYEYYRYYGIVNGYVVFTIADGSYPINTHYLAGHTMYFKYPSSIYIYADGEFMLMSNAYSDGILSSEGIGEIARRHWLYNDYLGLPNVKPEITVEKTQPQYLEFEGLEPLTEDEMHTIREAFAKYLYDNDYDNKYRLYLSSYGAEIAELFAKELLEGAYEQYRENLFNEDNYYYYGYLGKFGDSVVLLRRSSIGPVAQYKFEGKEYWVQSPGIYIYNNGEIIGLNDAYEKGLLNIDQIDEIFNVRIKRYNDKIF